MASLSSRITWVSPPCPCSRWHSIVGGVRVAVGQLVEDRQGRCCGSRGWSQDSLSRSKSARRINWYKHYPTGWQKEYTTSKLRQNYTFHLQIFLLVTSRHQRWLGFQLCIPFFHIHLCTVGQFLFPRSKIWNWPQGQTKVNRIFIFIKINLN